MGLKADQYSGREEEVELIVYRIHGVDTDESATTSFRPPRQLSWLPLLSCEKNKTLFSQSRSENPTDKYTRQSLSSYGRPPVRKKRTYILLHDIRGTLPSTYLAEHLHTRTPGGSVLMMYLRGTKS